LFNRAGDLSGSGRLGGFGVMPRTRWAVEAGPVLRPPRHRPDDQLSGGEMGASKRALLSRDQRTSIPSVGSCPDGFSKHERAG